MALPFIHIENKWVDVDQTKPLHAGIMISRHSLSRIISNPQQQLIYSISIYSNYPKSPGRKELDSWLKDPLLAKTEQIIIAIDTPKFTLMPVSLMDQKDAYTYLDLVWGIQGDEEVITQPIDEECQSIFALKKATHQYFLQRWPKAIFTHAASSLLKSYRSHRTESNELQVFLYVQEKDLVLTVYRGQTLCLHQAYEDCSETDMLYYILESARFVNIPATEMALSLHGQSSQMPSIATFLKSYLPQLEYLPFRHGYAYPESLHQYPSYLFNTLFSLLPCE